MKIQKPEGTTTVYVKTLNRGDRITVPGRKTVLLVESTRVSGNLTTVNITVPDHPGVRSTFTVPSLSTAFLHN